MTPVSVLCVDRLTNYRHVLCVDLWDKTRDAYGYHGRNRVVAHPPCAQWSRLRTFAKECQLEKDLAAVCLYFVNHCGGVLEHPMGSSFFRFYGVRPTLSVNQSWFGFRSRKATWLYFVDCKPLSHPLSFDLPTHKTNDLRYSMRSRMTVSMCQWLVDSVRVPI